MSSCACHELHGKPKLIVVTGGPGAGKTAVLELVRRHFCEHVTVLPEAASIVFGGGFPRRPTTVGRVAAQRAIFHVQRELEVLAMAEGNPAVIVCDRGTVDGLAYWPDGAEAGLRDLGISLEEEVARYATVIHLRTPAAEHGYNYRNPLRTETPAEAVAIDERIATIWASHPQRIFVEKHDHFLDKARNALEVLRRQVPTCCRSAHSF